MAQQEVDRLGTESITKLLLQSSLPATLAMLVNASYNIVDTIFVGRLGSEAIAALSVALPMQIMMGAYFLNLCFFFLVRHRPFWN